MFIALYEFKIKEGMSGTFQRSWLKTTQGIYHEFGSLGSRLHKTEDFLTFVAYAQWPSKEQWVKDKGDLGDEYFSARSEMWKCIADSRTVYEMEVTDDYLHSLPFVV
ncbi:MAG: antibiotic biosynthesis monooxygenase [Desulfobacteraceae bacterium]|nr:antibiotic biosynthesis monooxygenase [Desulfobacteraceae bacterium]